MRIKKITLAITSTAILGSTLAVAACNLNRGPKYSHYGYIQVVTDTGSVEDHSFNESAFQAAKDYSEIVQKDDKSVTYGFSQPQYKTKNSMRKSYISSLKSGTDILLLPGFLHQMTSDSEHFAIENHKEFPKAKYIVIDAIPSSDPKIIKDPTILSNAGWYKLNFAAEESGFLSAVYTGIYFNQIKHETNPIKVATYGGMQIAGVTPFMDGWLQGINFFNKQLKTSSTTKGWQELEPYFHDKSHKASNASTDFTGSFAPGLATSISRDYINAGVKAIMPVAGPQTGDTVGVIASMKKTGQTYIIAPDTDQSKVYAPEYFLGTAIKGIYAASTFAIDQLRKKPGRAPFPNFSTKSMSKNTEWNSFKTDLKAKLKKRGNSDYEIHAKTLLTGFLPSEWLSKDKATKSLESTAIYKAAIQEVETNPIAFKLVPNQTTASQNAQDTYKKYGGFWK